MSIYRKKNKCILSTAEEISSILKVIIIVTHPKSSIHIYVMAQVILIIVHFGIKVMMKMTTTEYVIEMKIGLHVSRLINSWILKIAQPKSSNSTHGKSSSLVPFTSFHPHRNIIRPSTIKSYQDTKHPKIIQSLSKHKKHSSKDEGRLH